MHLFEESDMVKYYQIGYL